MLVYTNRNAVFKQRVARENKKNYYRKIEILKDTF